MKVKVLRNEYSPVNNDMWSLEDIHGEVTMVPVVYNRVGWYCLHDYSWYESLDASTGEIIAYTLNGLSGRFKFDLKMFSHVELSVKEINAFKVVEKYLTDGQREMLRVDGMVKMVMNTYRSTRKRLMSLRKGVE